MLYCYIVGFHCRCVVSLCCPSWGVCHNDLGTVVVVVVVAVVVELYADIHIESFILIHC